MAVCDGCPNNNFEGGRPPDGNDDPCDTSEIGIFCTGSYWLYNPDLSVDTDLYGDCPRLFIRIGDQCGVNEWLELSTQDSIINANAPTDEDCCPSGTLWIRPAALSGQLTDEVYISYADFSVEPPICRWCDICSGEITCETLDQTGCFIHQTGRVSSATVNQPLPLPVGNPLTPLTQVGVNTVIVANNTSNVNMLCTFDVENFGFGLGKTIPSVDREDIQVALHYSFDGGVTWLGSVNNVNSITLDGGQTGVYENSVPGLTVSRIVAAGGTLDFRVRRSYRSFGGFTGDFFFMDAVATHHNCVGLPST